MKYIPVISIIFICLYIFMREFFMDLYYVITDDTSVKNPAKIKGWFKNIALVSTTLLAIIYCVIIS